MVEQPKSVIPTKSQPTVSPFTASRGAAQILVNNKQDKDGSFVPRALPASVLDRVVQSILWSIHVSRDDVRRRPGHHVVRGKGVHVVVRRVQHLGACKKRGLLGRDSTKCTA